MNFYYAVTVTGDEEKTKEKYYSYVIKISDADNMLCKIPKNCKHMNAAKTKKEAKKLAAFWNECYKNNGSYLFGEVAF